MISLHKNIPMKVGDHVFVFYPMADNEDMGGDPPDRGGFWGPGVIERVYEGPVVISHRDGGSTTYPGPDYEVELDDAPGGSYYCDGDVVAPMHTEV